MHQQSAIKEDNVLSVKSVNKKLKEKISDLDKPILGIAESKVVTEAELLSKRASAYPYIL